jgi:hypothetical protein
MPNWCDNRLEIFAENKEGADQLKRFIEQAAKDVPEQDKSPLHFVNFVPYPNGEWNYDWCVNNWGTKWDVSEVDLDQDTEYDDHGFVYYCFQTAWAPPVEWLKKVAKMFPELRFRLKYEEEGVGFMGVAFGQKTITDNEISYS